MFFVIYFFTTICSISRIWASFVVELFFKIIIFIRSKTIAIINTLLRVRPNLTLCSYFRILDNNLECIFLISKLNEKNHHKIFILIKHIINIFLLIVFEFVNITVYKVKLKITYKKKLFV